jgi:hypothetical protein
MSKICNGCAQELPDSATVCSLCGEQLISSNVISTKSPTVQAKSSQPNTPPFSSAYIPPPAPATMPQPAITQPTIFNSESQAVRKRSPKMIAIIAAAAIIICIIIGMLVSGGGGNALVGAWNYDMYASEGPPLLLSDSIEFASNGTLRYSQGSGFRDAGTWSASGGKLNFDAGGGYKGSLEYKVRGNTLTLTGNWELVYTKRK